MTYKTIKPLNGWVLVDASTENMYQGTTSLVLLRPDGVRSLRGTVVAVSEDITEVAVGDLVWYQVGSGHTAQKAPIDGHPTLVVIPVNRDVSLVEIINRLQRMKDDGQDVSAHERAVLGVSQDRGDVVWRTGRRGCGIFAREVDGQLVPINKHSVVQLGETSLLLRAQEVHPTLLATTDPTLPQRSVSWAIRPSSVTAIRVRISGAPSCDVRVLIVVSPVADIPRFHSQAHRRSLAIEKVIIILLNDVKSRALASAQHVAARLQRRDTRELDCCARR